MKDLLICDKESGVEFFLLNCFNVVSIHFLLNVQSNVQYNVILFTCVSLENTKSSCQTE